MTITNNGLCSYFDALDSNQHNSASKLPLPLKLSSVVMRIDKKLAINGGIGHHFLISKV
jgi:hypothetical protein